MNADIMLSDYIQLLSVFTEAFWIGFSPIFISGLVLGVIVSILTVIVSIPIMVKVKKMILKNKDV